MNEKREVPQVEPISALVILGRLCRVLRTSGIAEFMNLQNNYISIPHTCSADYSNLRQLFLYINYFLEGQLLNLALSSCYASHNMLIPCYVNQVNKLIIDLFMQTITRR